MTKPKGVMAIFVDRLPAEDDRLLRADAVMELMGINKDIYHRLRHDPEFPRPIRITPHNIGHWRSEIVAYLDTKRLQTLMGAFELILPSRPATEKVV